MMKDKFFANLFKKKENKIDWGETLENFAKTYPVAAYLGGGIIGGIILIGTIVGLIEGILWLINNHINWLWWGIGIILGQIVINFINKLRKSIKYIK